MSSLICLAILLVAYDGKAQSWSKSFRAGGDDLENAFLGGSEVLQLVSHKGMLFASVGYWQDENNIWYGGTNPNIGWGQVIRLDGPENDWEEDLFLGASHLRPEVLKQVIFTRDSEGNFLAEPDTVLITAAYSPNYINSTVTVSSFSRDDEQGFWESSQIMKGDFPAGENYSIRDIEVYLDSETGLEYIFATVGTKGIFRGKYKPDIQGKINWVESPEFGPLEIRSLGITIANSKLYFSSGNMLYQRNDGVAADYTLAHDFSDLSMDVNSAVGGVRGLTTIANPNGGNEALLVMWCPDGQSKAVIYRLEPDGLDGFDRIYETKISTLIENYLPGSTAHYVLGAYNDFYEFEDPLSSEIGHLVGFETKISGGSFPTWNGYYRGGLYVKRSVTADYSVEEIDGGIDDSDTALVSTRCYVKSPFSTENALYFGGFDPNGITATNMAWIYKKKYQFTSVDPEKHEKGKLSIAPNPAINELFVAREIAEPVAYEIMSLDGRKEIGGMLYDPYEIIDISKLPPGMNILRVGNESYTFSKLE